MNYNIYNTKFQLIMMNSQTIFSNQINQQEADILQEITDTPLCNLYLKKGDSSKYIDQFLQKNEPPQMKTPLTNQNYKISDRIQQAHHEQSISLGTQNLQNIPNQLNQSTSMFHNFQKHLSIFLKHHMKSNKKQALSQQQIICQKLRKTFLSSTFNSKKLIHLIFGQINIKGKQKTLKQYGVKQIYSKYSQEQIRNGKQLLRSQTLKQTQNVDLKCYLSGTRIKNKEFFVLYVKNFMNELKDGVFNKRVKKQRVLDVR